MVMADAVKAIQNPRDYYDKGIEQMPNPAFADDLDKNGRPDGYADCRYASAEARVQGKGRVAEFENGTTTWIYGPEPGRTQFSSTARFADCASLTLTPVLGFTEIGKDYGHRVVEDKPCGTAALRGQGQRFSFPVIVGEEVDRVRIRFDVAPPGKVHVSDTSWRLAD